MTASLKTKLKKMIKEIQRQLSFSKPNKYKKDWKIKH